MKKLLVGLITAGIVFSATYAFAASARLSPQSFGAGSAPVAACQSAPVDVSFDARTNADGSQSTDVVVGNLDTSPSACGNKQLKVTLLGNGSVLGERAATIPSSGTSATLPFDADPAAITGVRVTIAG